MIATVSVPLVLFVIEDVVRLHEYWLLVSHALSHAANAGTSIDKTIIIALIRILNFIYFTSNVCDVDALVNGDGGVTLIWVV